VDCNSDGWARLRCEGGEVKEILAQWSLVEVVAAKIDRRLELLAEVHRIEQELLAVGVILREVPSVKAQQEEVIVAPVVIPVAKLKVRRKRETRMCACGAKFRATHQSTRSRCDQCLKTFRTTHMRELHKTRGLRLANE
jgi:hypothetical protein